MIFVIICLYIVTTGQLYVEGHDDARDALVDYLANFKNRSYVFIKREELEVEEKTRHVIPSIQHYKLPSLKA